MTQKTEGLTAGEAFPLYLNGTKLTDKTLVVWHIKDYACQLRELKRFIDGAPFRLAPVESKQEKGKAFSRIVEIYKDYFGDNLGLDNANALIDFIRDEARKIAHEEIKAHEALEEEVIEEKINTWGDAFKKIQDAYDTRTPQATLDHMRRIVREEVAKSQEVGFRKYTIGGKEFVLEKGWTKEHGFGDAESPPETRQAEKIHERATHDPLWEKPHERK